jgi:hypothetical protein
MLRGQKLFLKIFGTREIQKYEKNFYLELQEEKF